MVLNMPDGQESRLVHARKSFRPACTHARPLPMRMTQELASFSLASKQDDRNKSGAVGGAAGAKGPGVGGAGGRPDGGAYNSAVAGARASASFITQHEIYLDCALLASGPKSNRVTTVQ